MNRWRFLAASVAVGALPVLLTAGDQDFWVVNKTGFDIYAIQVAPHRRDEWGEDVMGEDTLDDGEKVKIVFSRRERAAKWDLRVEDEDEKSYVWENLNLLKISTVTLFCRKGIATATFS